MFYRNNCDYLSVYQQWLILDRIITVRKKY